ncbi:hypothetical protein KC573_03695, partial [candidate division WWE3 bacterium]|nr:hypothetical protein [candidate division WWE3 bacterium]
ASSNWLYQSWSNVYWDMNFRINMGGSGTYFQGASGVTVGGDLHANTIDSVTVSGDAYYQSINNATAANYYPGSTDPSQTDFPISNAQITQWKDEALNGGVHTGNYTACGTSIGPLKIEGDLILWNNCDVTVTGTLYVDGIIDIRSGSSLVLDSSFGGNGGVVVSSEHIRLETSAAVTGSGNGDSYMLLISEGVGPSPTREAIEIRTGDVNIDDVILFAPNGTVKIFQGGATLLELAGKKIEIADNVGLVYEQGLANATFAAGGDSAWEMRDGTWLKF